MSRRGGARRWVIWMSVVVPYLLAFFQRLALNTAGDPIRAMFHWSAAQFGVLAGAYFIAASAMRIPSGVIADRWGARRLAVGSMLLGAVGALLFSQSQSLPIAAATRVIVALGDSAIFVSLIRLQADWFEHNEFATLSGLSLFMAGIGFWLTTTPLAAALRIASWRTIFEIVGWIGLVLTALAFWVIPPQSDTAPSRSPADRRVPLAQQVAHIVGNPYAWPSIVLFMALYSIWTVFGATWGVPYWNQVQRVSLNGAANRFSLFVAAFAVCSWILGRLSDRWKDRRRLQVIAGLVVLFAITIMAARPQLPAGWALVLFMAVGAATGVTPACYASMRENNPPNSPGLAIGVLLTASDLAAAGTQYLSGRLLGTGGALGPSGKVIYSAHDYSRIWWMLVGWTILWVLAGLATRETRAANRWSPRVTHSIKTQAAVTAGR